MRRLVVLVIDVVVLITILLAIILNLANGHLRVVEMNSSSPNYGRLNPVDLLLVLLLPSLDFFHFFSVPCLADLGGLAGQLCHLNELAHVLIHSLQLSFQLLHFLFLL